MIGDDVASDDGDSNACADDVKMMRRIVMDANCRLGQRESMRCCCSVSNSSDVDDDDGDRD